MLYQTWESSPLFYALKIPGGNYLTYGLEDGDYAESLYSGAGQIFHVFVDKDLEVPGEATVYVYAQMDYHYHPSWRIAVYAIDGVTGEILWKDTESWRNNIFLVGLVNNFMVDNDGRTWISNAYGHCYRSVLYNDDTEVNQFAKKSGMPNYLLYDIRIEHEEWLNPEGGAMSPGVSRVLAVLPSQNRTIAVYYDSLTDSPTSFGNDDRRYVGIFEYSSRRLLTYLKVPGDLQRLVIVDTTTAYGIHTGGMISVIDYKALRVRGVVYAGPTTGVGGISRWSSAAYDPVYRRLIGAAPSPDAEDGASTTRLKAYSTKEIPIGLLPPIPQQIPRKGRTVGIFSRVYGDGGHGIPGVRVSANIASGGNNTINPSSQITDSNGHVFFKYACNDSGAAIDDIELSIDYETIDPDFVASNSQAATVVAPYNTRTGDFDEKYFEPGHWGWSPWSNDSPAQKWGAFLDGYAVGEHPLRGVVQEYSWIDFEYAVSQFSWSKVQADIDYLSARGLKLMIAMKLKSPSDSLAWIPEDIRDYVRPPEAQSPEDEVEEPLWPRSEQEVPFLLGWSGVMHLENTQGVGFYPMLWHPAMLTRYQTLLASMALHFSPDATVVGYFPAGTDYIHSTDHSRVGQDYRVTDSNAFRDMRRGLLTYMQQVAGKPVWDIFQSLTYSSKWHSDNGINYTSDRWSLTGSTSNYFGYTTNQVWRSVGTGYRIASSDWGQLTCQGTVATPMEFVFGGPNMSNEDPPCAKQVLRFSGSFWYGFYDLVEPQYSLAEEGIEAMALDQDLPLSNLLRGG
jgi:hypothetical protein